LIYAIFSKKFDTAFFIGQFSDINGRNEREAVKPYSI